MNPIPNVFPNLYMYSVSETSRLTGVPEETIIKIAKDLLDLEVDEGDLSVDQILSADEVFCTGTAVVVSPVGKVTYQNKVRHFLRS